MIFLSWARLDLHSLLDGEDAGMDGQIINSGDIVFLKGSHGTGLHSNIEEGGMFSGGPFNPDVSWELITEGGGEINFGDAVLLKSTSSGESLATTCTPTLMRAPASRSGFDDVRMWKLIEIGECPDYSPPPAPSFRNGCIVHLGAMGLGDGR